MASKPTGVAQERRTPPVSTSAPPQASKGPQKQGDEPAEKHVCPPPAPADCGPWQAGPWQVRRTTTYAPAARVVLTGPAEDFDRLLDYLEAFPSTPPPGA